MSTPIQPISRYMTSSPHTVALDETMAHAHALMREHRIRHLPVLRAGKLVGIVSDGDLHLIETLKDVDPESVPIEDAMTGSPYAVAPETPLEEVVATMAEHKYGCTVVVDDEHVVGIFTTVDACRALAQLLHARAPAAPPRSP